MVRNVYPGLSVHRSANFTLAKASIPWVSPCNKLAIVMGMSRCTGGGSVSRRVAPGSPESEILILVEEERRIER